MIGPGAGAAGMPRRTASVRRRAARAGLRHGLCVMATLLIAALGAATLTGCGSSGHVHFAKTKFLLHAGLAFGAFHRYIYKPYRSGGFTPISQHKTAIVKAGVAALFIYHELKIARTDAASSPTLSKLLHPIVTLESRFTQLHHSLSGGSLSGSAISSTNQQLTSLAGQSSRGGATIHDLASSLGG
jgi:hypothetical protein